MSEPINFAVESKILLSQFSEDQTLLVQVTTEFLAPLQVREEEVVHALFKRAVSPDTKGFSPIELTIVTTAKSMDLAIYTDLLSTLQKSARNPNPVQAQIKTDTIDTSKSSPPAPSKLVQGSDIPRDLTPKELDLILTLHLKFTARAKDDRNIYTLPLGRKLDPGQKVPQPICFGSKTNFDPGHLARGLAAYGITADKFKEALDAVRKNPSQQPIARRKALQ
ncbi:Uncharacterised protein [Candidatus Gugararchaeum adminiculabundum]|nr:Uncharacterised protein [Candidatus Gugararchaeum adminiculabundum]